MKSVFNVSHIYTIDAFLDDEREIGVFLDRKMANSAVGFLKEKEGFEKYPDSFVIDELLLNEPHWSLGFG